MTFIRIFSTALIAVSAATPALAQQRPAQMASAPMAAASMPVDCAKPMARHDHGADKGSPQPKSKSGPCAPAKGASAATVKR